MGEFVHFNRIPDGDRRVNLVGCLERMAEKPEGLTQLLPGSTGPGVQAQSISSHEVATQKNLLIQYLHPPQLCRHFVASITNWLETKAWRPRQGLCQPFGLLHLRCVVTSEIV